MEPVDPIWTVYFHSDDWRTPGGNTVMQEVFVLLKMENIATHEGYQQISPDLVLDSEPDIIIADSIEQIVENPDLSSLHMVQDKTHIPHHIFVLSRGLSFDVDDHHFMDAVEDLAAFVYPEVFASDDGHDHGDNDHSH